MSLTQDYANNWRRIIKEKADQEIKEYLLSCDIKKIQISQAKKAWEIYFQCPFKPDDKLKNSIAIFWENVFGKQNEISYHFAVNKIYKNLEQYFTECRNNIIERVSKNMPSCRGWLGDAEYLFFDNQLQIIVKQEIGYSYLNAHGIKQKLEEIITAELEQDIVVTITFDESAEYNDSCLYNIEESYREKLQQSIIKSSKAQIAKENVDEIIMGKKITGEPVNLNTVNEEENDLIIKGYVFDLEQRLLKSGRTIMLFNISDKTNSVACKVFLDADDKNNLKNKIKEYSWYKIRGKIQFDRYTQELTFLPQDINHTTNVIIRDNSIKKRIELHLHTKSSALDSVASVRDVVKRAVEWGHPAVAITDHGVVQAFPEAYEAAEKKQIKIIYGLEGYLFDDTINYRDKKIQTYHCTIIALTQEGLRNLYELVTLSHVKYYYRVPRIPKSELNRLRKDLFIGSACEAGELIRCYLRGGTSEELESIGQFYDYFEIQPRGNNEFMLHNGQFSSVEEILEMNRAIYHLGKKLNKPVVATGDVHFLDPDDEIYRRILMKGKGFEDADNQAPLYFKTTDEMLTEFSYLGKSVAEEVVIENSNYIANLVCDGIKPIPDELYPPEIEGAEEEISQLTYSNAWKLYGQQLPDLVQARIEKELKAIIDNGFAVLYLIAHKLVKRSNEDGYIVGSRGSVGSSLVATLCNITEVNPLLPHYRCECCYSQFINDSSIGSGADLPDKICPHCGKELIKDGHNIPFEVFMGFKGDKVPDIDLNFSGDYQPSAHKYIEELFGKDNVFRAGTIATIANKTAFGFVKSYFQEKGQYIRSAEIQRLVSGCTGVKRTTGQHPGGIMVLPRGLDIHKFTPLQHPADDVKSKTITTHFDYHAISSRLVKLDILGHDDPTVLKMLGDLTGVDIKSIPLDENKVMSLFSGVEALGISKKDLGSNIGTLGIPEFGTKFVRQMLEDTKPQTFSDLVRISGFSHGTDVWLNNAQTLIRTGTAQVSEVISARDDIMTSLIQEGLKPDIAFKIMEDVRKGKGVKQEYVELMKDNSIPEWYIISCQKIKYLFPKAHATAYVMMAFRIAFFKVYYPAAFYASFFSVRADEFDADIIVKGIDYIKKMMDAISQKGNDATQKEEKLYTILEVALEMYLRGHTLKKVDIFCSDSTRFLIEDNNKSLRPPLVSLQGLGKTVALSIIKARQEKPFTSQEDLRLRGKVNKSVMEVLSAHGSLDKLDANDQITLF